jgi:hypothetical protein
MLIDAPAARSIGEPAPVLEQVSPELVLVDADLRRLLIEQYAYADRDLDAMTTNHAPEPVEAAAAPASSIGVRMGTAERHGRLLLAAVVGSGVTLLGVFAATFVDSGPARVTTSVAAAPLSPPSSHTAALASSVGQHASSVATSTTRRIAAQSTKPPRTPTPRAVARKFAWAPSAGATAYEVAFYKNNELVYRVRTKRAVVSIAEGTRKATLRPGTYEWYVWPVRDERRDSVAVVRSRVVVPASR